MLLQKNTAGKLRNILFVLAMLVVLTIVLGPYMWMVSSSFKTNLEIQGMEPSWIPRTFTLDNYVKMNTLVPLWHYFKNSLIISSGTMILTLLIGTLAAYSLSRFKFWGKTPYIMTLFSTQVLPGILFLIPYFVIFNWIFHTFEVRMTNTYHGLIITYTQFSLPFATLMIMNYLSSVPREIDEQAMIDGCSRVGALFRVIIPLAKPGIAAAGIYSFWMGWNEILFAQILTRRDIRPLAVGLLDFRQQTQSQWGSMMAACIVTTIPIIILFSLMSKQIVSELTSGATKG
ncbi:MAG: carbohydrate ABC transporter permease [Halanaerobiales bacterium]